MSLAMHAHGQEKTYHSFDGGFCMPVVLSVPLCPHIREFEAGIENCIHRSDCEVKRPRQDETTYCGTRYTHASISPATPHLIASDSHSLPRANTECHVVHTTRLARAHPIVWGVSRVGGMSVWGVGREFVQIPAILPSSEITPPSLRSKIIPHSRAGQTF